MSTSTPTATQTARTAGVLAVAAAVAVAVATLTRAPLPTTDPLTSPLPLNETHCTLRYPPPVTVYCGPTDAAAITAAITTPAGAITRTIPTTPIDRSFTLTAPHPAAITIAPISITIRTITLTATISDWSRPLTLTGAAPVPVTLTAHRWHTPTQFYTLQHFTVASDGTQWTYTPPGPILQHPRDYWTITAAASPTVTHIAPVFTRRLIFPIIRR